MVLIYVVDGCDELGRELETRWLASDDSCPSCIIAKGNSEHTNLINSILQLRESIAHLTDFSKNEEASLINSVSRQSELVLADTYVH